MPASTPLPYTTVSKLSAYDMIDSMGTVTCIKYQMGGTSVVDFANRNGEIELIHALEYLGIHHIRNEGIDADPNQNWATVKPGSPCDLDNFLTLRAALPKVKLNFLIPGGERHWGDGSPSDYKVTLLKLAKMGALASIEGPNEPNNQICYSPTGRLYPQSTASYNQIWTEWGAAMKALKNSDPAFANVLLLPPTSAVHGGNGPDGVESTYTAAGVTDHTAYYDMMNFHSYSAEPIQGLSLGDPRGDITSGNPLNWGCYQVSITNWGRYAMPGKPAIITESGANSQLGGPVTEQAQGLAIVNNYFWAKYYNAVRLYQYQVTDDSTDMFDENVTRWGFFRGDWSKKPAAQYVHNFTGVLADIAQSNPSTIPNFTVSGKNATTWGATMAFSKSDGSYVIACNNTLAWWDPATGRDITPTAETWTITFPTHSVYTVTDVKTGLTTAPQTGKTVSVAVSGYPMLVRVVPDPSTTTVVLTGGTSWLVPAGVTKLAKVECWGGGGGGSALLNGAGGNGGGGGAYAAIADFTVTPGQSIAYAIGAGGAGGGAFGSSAGGAGGMSWFHAATTVKAAGGAGGALMNNATASGGTAANCVGTTRYGGGNGAPNSVVGGDGGAGGAAASPSGAGSAGSNSAGTAGSLNLNGVSRIDGGSGGGGSGYPRSGDGGAPGGGGGGDAANISNGGGAGGRGQIRITYMA